MRLFCDGLSTWRADAEAAKPWGEAKKRPDFAQGDSKNGWPHGSSDSEVGAHGEIGDRLRFSTRILRHSALKEIGFARDRDFVHELEPVLRFRPHL